VVRGRYAHDWVSAGRFGLQVSFRAAPLLPVRPMPLRRERYFDWLGMIPPPVPSLDLHEMIGEKVRAAVQRSRVRDLYDLYQLANQWSDLARPVERTARAQGKSKAEVAAQVAAITHRQRAFCLLRAAA